MINHYFGLVGPMKRVKKCYFIYLFLTMEAHSVKGTTSSEERLEGCLIFDAH